MHTTTNHPRRLRRAALVAISATFVVAQTVGTSHTSAQEAEPVDAPYTVSYQTDPIPFTIDDIIGDVTGITEGTSGDVVIGDDEGEDTSGNIINAKNGFPLYPIDSSFTFETTDFYGAEPVAKDGVAEEGWAGPVVSVIDGVEVSGVQFSDVETDQLKSGAPIGTWAAGLGDTSVKASTEHFTVMEGILTCYQTYDYDFWDSYEDWATGEPSVPDETAAKLAELSAETGLTLECTPLTDPDMLVELDGVTPGDLNLLIANEDSVVTDILVDPDKNYSVTKKDDGKLLFRWGQMVKRPTDIRFQKSIPLPEEWLLVPDNEKGFQVTKAELVVRHRVTNNPNDQIRPEDWENEAATGWLPGYTVTDQGYWLSDTGCYEGDGDYIPAATILKYPDGAMPDIPASDLKFGYTAAWYTTIDRDPFQWAYDTGAGTVGSRTSDESLGELLSGPRWRLTSNKFGQDLPGLEIPSVACTPPPYQQGETRYDTGDLTTTVINLLDWSDDEWKWDDAASPLAWSAGWTHTWTEAATDADFVPGMNIDPADAERCSIDLGDGNCVTSLGTTLTDAFDVTFYVKGDQKPLEVYDVQLVLEYATEEPPPEILYDFGDAPELYADDAFAIASVTGPMLGTTVDAELATLYSADATGDDTDNLDDEDGVVFESYGPLASATISMTGAGYVQGWVDYNHDGTFDPAEQIVTDLDHGARVIFDAPIGETVARFRIAEEPGVGPIGAGGVGEVEDYSILIDPAGDPDVALTTITAVPVFDQRVGPGTTAIHVTELGDVPWYATDVALKISTSDADAPGSLTAVSCDNTALVADLLYRPGTDAFTTAIAPVNSDGDVCLQVSKETVEVTVEVIGYTTALGTYSSVAPGTVFTGTMAPDQVVESAFTLDPGEGTAYLVAVSSDKAKGRGEVSFYLDADPTLRYDVLSTLPGRQQTNLMVLPAGSITVDTEAATNLVVEVRGVFTDLMPAPTTVFDGHLGVGNAAEFGPLGSGATFVNVSVANPDADGAITLSHPNSTLPNLAFDKKDAASGLAIVAPTTIEVTTTADVDLVIDEIARTQP